MRYEVVPYSVQCPYCWQSFEISVDCSVDHQNYIEDCEVCCRPIILDITVSEEGEVWVDALSEEDG
ncbi:MAG: CPXCG motif-containing cysteine-rich protein [Fibrobacterales bacterium]